jgi:hypothetical protein
MKKIILLLLVSISSFAQSYKFSVGSNITSFVFNNSDAANPPSLRPSSGLHVSLSDERELKSISKYLLVDMTISYNQYNSVGDVQKIPFSYSTDFIGLGMGIGPRLSFGKGITFIVKGHASTSKMVNGNQFLLNHYVDLSGDDQFNSFRNMFGYSFELNKQISPQLGMFIKYQHLNSISAKTSLNIIPSTFSIGLSLTK